MVTVLHVKVKGRVKELQGEGYTEYITDTHAKKRNTAASVFCHEAGGGRVDRYRRRRFGGDEVVGEAGAFEGACVFVGALNAAYGFDIAASGLRYSTYVYRV
mmetsp:Transcript_22038/g.41451  ORF Transcript_22038/g.41451 Transcript_22038/m.41451 type:complete len:102 (-) Transcript_22038:31-336(-)